MHIVQTFRYMYVALLPPQYLTPLDKRADSRE